MALVVWLNVGVVALYWFLAITFIPVDRPAGRELLAVTHIAAPVVMGVLLLFSLYLATKNQTLILTVTSTEFHYVDPLFTGVGCRLPVQDIVEVVQTVDVRGDFFESHFVLRDGRSQRVLLGNYRIDRAGLFRALQKANPAIRVPDKAYSYKRRRPAWAKRLRGE